MIRWGYARWICSSFRILRQNQFAGPQAWQLSTSQKQVIQHPRRQPCLSGAVQSVLAAVAGATPPVLRHHFPCSTLHKAHRWWYHPRGACAVYTTHAFCKRSELTHATHNEQRNVNAASCFPAACSVVCNQIAPTQVLCVDNLASCQPHKCLSRGRSSSKPQAACSTESGISPAAFGEPAKL